jgi:hypothetical protein
LAILFISFHFCGKEAITERLAKLEAKIVDGETS